MTETSISLPVEVHKVDNSAEKQTGQDKKSLVEKTKQKAKDFANVIRTRLHRNSNPVQGFKDITALNPSTLNFDTSTHDNARARQDAILGNKNLSPQRRDELLRATLTPASEIVQRREASQHDQSNENISPEAKAAAEKFKKRVAEAYANQATHTAHTSETAEGKRGSDADVLRLADTLKNSKYFEGNGAITDDELLTFMRYVQSRAEDRRQMINGRQADRSNGENTPHGTPEPESNWLNQSSIPIHDEIPDPDLDMWEKLMDMTDGDPTVVPADIQRDVVSRIDKRNDALKQNGRLQTSSIHDTTERTQKERPATHEQKKIQQVEVMLQEQLKQHSQDLIRQMKLSGLNLTDLQQHAELFRIDSRDLRHISMLDQTSLDEILTHDEDPLMQSIREKLLADDPKKPDNRYAPIKGGVHRALESATTDLLAQSYLQHLSQKSGSQGLAEAIRLDREKLQAAGGADGDLAEVKQRMVTIGGTELNAHEADNLLLTLENLVTKTS